MINPAGIEQVVRNSSDIHYPKPRAVSITQATEVGTVYTADEIKAIWAKTKQFNLLLHMDGARFANAVAALGAEPKAITWQAGVDVLCFGGTKNGTHVGDAVVFFNRELAAEFDYRCKQAGQLCSKMRFLAAPWVGMLQKGAWLQRAAQANAMARRLHDALAALPEISILFPTQANAVFADLPPRVIRGLRQIGWKFYTFIGAGGCRLMCAWDTREEDVDRFVDDLKHMLVHAPNDTPTGAVDHRKL
jgi:threonine aldolase